MLELKPAIIGAAVTATAGGVGFLGHNYYEAKKEQVLHFADSRYVQQEAYVEAQNRQERRRIKKEIFEIKRSVEQEGRGLTNIEQNHLDDLHEQYKELQR